MIRAEGAVCLLAIVYNSVRFWEFRLADEHEIGAQALLRNQPIYYIGYYTSAYLVTHFLLPFSVLLILNSLVAVEIIRARNRREQLTQQQRGMFDNDQYH